MLARILDSSSILGRTNKPIDTISRSCAIALWGDIEDLAQRLSMMVTDVTGHQRGNTRRSSLRCSRRGSVDSRIGYSADDGIRAGFSGAGQVAGRVAVDSAVRLTKSKNENKGTIINRAYESTCFEARSVLTGATTPLAASQRLVLPPKLVGIKL